MCVPFLLVKIVQQPIFPSLAKKSELYAMAMFTLSNAYDELGAITHWEMLMANQGNTWLVTPIMLSTHHAGGGL